jgi:phosphate starvation-inducible protein PhoH and related proteins
VAKNMRNAKRANRPNPREDRNRDRNVHYINNTTINVDDSAKRKKVQLLPRNLAQEVYVDLLEDETKSIVFATGPAGTGKTLLATLYAIKQLQAGTIKKIIITRPAVSVDEQHGFLPGSLLEKMAPWVIPITDVFKEHYSVAALERMLADEVIEVAPLAYMRGRTLKNSIVIFDEAQNALPSQMKMVLTRIGDGSRMIITGDVQQHDRGFADNGLKDFLARLSLSKSEHIGVCSFDKCDVERHPAIEDVLHLYGELDD